MSEPSYESLPHSSSRKSDSKRESKDTGTILDMYFEELEDCSPLSAEKQNELAKKYHRQGDRKASKKLIATNLRFVVKLASEHKQNERHLSDLIQAGSVGLVEGLKKYDPDRSAQFITYAKYWIRARMSELIKGARHPVKIYTNRAGRLLFNNLRKTEKMLRKDGIEPTPEAVSDELGIDEKDVRQIGASLKFSPLSFDKQIYADSSKTVGDQISGAEASPESRVGDYKIMDEIQDFIKRFGQNLETPRQRAIWKSRTTNTAPRTLRTLGEEWNVSKERIRQVEVSMLDDAKKELREIFDGELEQLVTRSSFGTADPQSTFYD